MPDTVTTLVALVAASLIALMKRLAPVLHEKVPNFLWPLVAMGLAWAGTETCKSLGASCSGNPLEWGTPQATAAATALLSVVMREMGKAGKPQLEKLLAYLRDLGGQ